MPVTFGKSFLGFKPGEVLQELERLDEQHRMKAEELLSEISQVKEKLQQAEQEVLDLRKRLDDYHSKEQLIGQTLVMAQKNAVKIETEARENSRAMLEKADQELRIKEQELNLLKAKVSRFKEEFREVLDNYRYSLENMKEPLGELGGPVSVLRGGQVSLNQNKIETS